MNGPQSNPVNSFRKQRGLRLGKQISNIAAQSGRNVRILDVGGTPLYWDNIDTSQVSDIIILNYQERDLGKFGKNENLSFTAKIGDARDLHEHADQSFDLIHSNSVIEHVGNWSDMMAMASEVRRVGKFGWMQTPAWEFPFEPHFRLPFMHWFSAPARKSMLYFSSNYGKQSISQRRRHVERVNLVSGGEFRTLFPDCDIFVERMALLPKSYVATW